MSDDLNLPSPQKEIYDLLKKKFSEGTPSEKKGATRGELVNALKIPRTTIYDNLVKLEKQRLVSYYLREKEAGKNGRCKVVWYIKTRKKAE